MRRVLVVVILLLSATPASAQVCDLVTWPWQGAKADGASAGNTRVTVPASSFGKAIYPVDIVVPPGARTVSLFQWFHLFPYGVEPWSVELREWMEQFPHQRPALTPDHQEAHDLGPELSAYGRDSVRRNLSQPLRHGYRYFVSARNKNPFPVDIFLAVTGEVCFESVYYRDEFRRAHNRADPKNGIVR